MLVKLTLSGLYNFDQTIFDELTLPDGVSRETFIGRLFYRAGEFPLAYMDPDYIRSYLGNFSSVFGLEMEKTWSALREDYNPIHNYDRFEEYQDSETGQSQNAATSSDTTDTTSQDAYMGDNATSFNPANQTTNNSTNGGKSSVQASGTTTRDHSAHMYGNIGVTTSQQMLESEIDLRMKNSWYDLWTSRIVSELCIPLY